MSKTSKKYLRLKCHIMLLPDTVLTIHLRSTFETAWERNAFFEKLMIDQDMMSIIENGGKDLLLKIKQEFPFEDKFRKVMKIYGMKYDSATERCLHLYFSYDLVKKTRNKYGKVSKRILSSHLLPYHLIHKDRWIMIFHESGNNMCEKLLNFK